MNAAIKTIVDRWVEAERADNSRQVEDVIAGDFMFVGPAGFILNREQYLARFDNGDLHNSSLEITGLNVREHDNLAVVIGVWRQETTWQGRPNNGNFRVTMIFTGAGDAWQLLGAQLSPMMGPA